METLSREDIEDLVTHVVPQKPFAQFVDDTVFLDIKELLSQHPDRPVQRWSENPRLYTLLRMLGYHDDSPVLHAFDREQIGDVWLPLSSHGLAQLSQLSQLSALGLSPADFNRTQLHVLSKSERMSEAQLLSPAHSHRHIFSGKSHFDDVETLGAGGSAEVARVKHKLSGKQFACKRIRRAKTIPEQRNQLIEFEQEVAVLQRIRHKHLVSFVASYTDFDSFSLILNPVAKDVLRSMLMRHTRDSPLPQDDVAVLRRSLGCLTTALAYLHEQRVRHKDIKPGNILLSDGRVYLCDFGISRDWSKSENSTTEGDVLKFTRRYCAPEVFGRDPRNTASDIWSLGCVFLEIITVIKGFPIHDMNDFLSQNSIEPIEQGLWCASEAMAGWLARIRSEHNDSADDVPLDWITPMIRTEPDERPKAVHILENIHSQSAEMPHPDLFIAHCCRRSDSMVPIEHAESQATDSSVLPQHPSATGLGISNASSFPPTRSSPQTYLGVKSHRTSSPASVERTSPAPPYTRTPSRDRSVSPRTQSTHNARDSTDIVPYSLEPVSSSPVKRHMGRFSTPSDSGSRISESLSGSRTRQSLAFSGQQRSPVPPPASFEVKCSCAARPHEDHIFNAAFTAVSPNFNAPTVETCAKCEVGENRVQIYQTPPEDPNVGRGGPGFEDMPMPKIWWVTRRLVVSYLSGTPEMRHCSSFWLPLAEMSFELHEAEVTLRWSDCNQMTARRSGNYGQHYDWIYNPQQPNNILALQFSSSIDAQRFVDAIRYPTEDGTSVWNGQRIEVSDSQDVQILDIGRRAPIGRIVDYRIVVVTRRESQTASSSKLYIRWPELDLDIRVHDSETDRFASAPDYQMTVKFDNITTPTYLSDARGEPAVNPQKTGRFASAHQANSSLVVTFPIGMRHSLPLPPSGVVAMLNSLTGWTLRYFANVDKYKSKNKRLGSKKFGRADIMLWEKEREDASGKRRGTQITFRQHDDTDKLWTSGTINDTTSISYSSSCEASITVSNKKRGSLLDIVKMSACSMDTPQKDHRHSHSRSHSDAHEDHSELVLTFEDNRYRLEFVNLVEYFKAAAAATATLARRSTSNYSSDIRRINSLASNDIHMSPPMR